MQGAELVAVRIAQISQIHLACSAFAHARRVLAGFAAIGDAGGVPGIGLRKPHPRIYEMMVERLQVDPNKCVYLDDLGVNLKPARAMGMTTIKVASGPQAIAELEAATGLKLG